MCANFIMEFGFTIENSNIIAIYGYSYLVKRLLLFDDQNGY